MSTQVLQQTRCTLHLSDPEREVLLDLLRQALGETRVEAHRTHTPDFRELVLDQQATIRGLIGKLERSETDQEEGSSAVAARIEVEGPLFEDLFIDDHGRFQMRLAGLADFLDFLRDHKVFAEIEASAPVRAGGALFGYGRLLHLYDADEAIVLHRTWRQSRGGRMGA